MGAGYSEASRLEGKTAYVVGGANSTGQAAIHFSLFAERVVVVIRASERSATMSTYLWTRVLGNPTIEVRFSTSVSGIDGDNVLRHITLRDRNSKARETVDSEHLFVCIGGRPNTTRARDTAILRDRSGYLVTGTDTHVDGKPPERWPLERPPRFLETSVPSSLAAGDVRLGSVKRFATAVGEGAMAVTSVQPIPCGTGSTPDLKALASGSMGWKEIQRENFIP